MNAKLGFFDWIEEDPKKFKEFHLFMTASRRMRPISVDWFPVQERIIDGYNPENKEPGEGHADDVLLVDIGGSQGRDLEGFRKKFPEAPGRLILEDRPLAVADAKFTAPNMEAIAYDFFTPQPVKGTSIPTPQRIVNR